MKLIPKGYKVYVVLDRVEAGKVGLVYTPDKHVEQSRIGKVMAIGGTVTDYKVGERVLVQFYGGIPIHLIKEGILDDTHRIFTESEILSAVEE